MPRPNVEAERRKQILEAACAVIAKAGLQQLRVADVAQEAGISSGTIHYYFETKKDLVAAAFEFNFAASLRRRRWMRESTVDPRQRLRDIVESYLPTTRKSLQAWRVWAELWAEGTRDPALQKVNDELYGQWRDVVRDAIAAIHPKEDPTELANMLIAMMDGLAVQVLLRSKNMPVETMRATCRAFIDSIH
jgi:AcrR family transcriptional regulator